MRRVVPPFATSTAPPRHWPRSARHVTARAAAALDRIGRTWACWGRQRNFARPAGLAATARRPLKDRGLGTAVDGSTPALVYATFGDSSTARRQQSCASWAARRPASDPIHDRAAGASDRVLP